MLNETPIAFESRGVTLRGYLLSDTDATTHRPTVIMAHGTSATIKMVAIEYARAFARAGLAVVTPVPYSPYLCAPYVQANVLLMVAPEDEMVHANYQVTRGAFDLMPGRKTWYDIADGHFGLIYHPSDRFDEAVSVQVKFLREHLDA